MLMRSCACGLTGELTGGEACARAWRVGGRGVEEGELEEREWKAVGNW